MKKLVREVLFGRNPLVSGAMALAVVMLIALGCSCNKDFNLSNSSTESNSNSSSSDKTSDTKTSSDSVPPKSTIETMVKKTTEQFRDGVQDENFSSLYNNASEDFKGTYTVDQVKDAFKSYIEKKKFVVPILDKVQSTSADFSQDPSIRTEKGLNILVTSGKFNTKPYAVRFDYEYVMRGGEWKLLKLVINIP